MRKSKKVIAFLMAALMCAGLLAGTGAFAALDYYQNWTSDNGNGSSSGTSTGSNGTVTFSCNLSTGNFSVTWRTTRQNFNNLQGVGWNTGKASRKIGYNLGVFSVTSGSTGCAYAGVYGWTRSDLIEYYVIDNWVNYRPTGGTRLGSVSSDGGTYDIYKESHNGPNINGSGPFTQVRSVRTSQRATRSNNTVTFQNHANAWNSAGARLGSSWSYQTYIVEGYNSAGSGNATVWES